MPKNIVVYSDGTSDPYCKGIDRSGLSPNIGPASRGHSQSAGALRTSPEGPVGVVGWCWELDGNTRTILWARPAWCALGLSLVPGLRPSADRRPGRQVNAIPPPRARQQQG